ncbi:hypothetical protein FGO68_gene6643 [Halteria grandinella]|uniref:Uncharacterized protein n=1 Tax=Halteria grandinella TaxID=5974 RepID=A0A8J8T442_HALGN|nr:hypothetical protein FGO68_gene6643 [Halteria grandinella]
MSVSSQNNNIQERQQHCKCNRDLKVRFYCAQANCQNHEEDIFFCDECFTDIIESGEPHSQKLITKLLEEMNNKCKALIQKEGQLYITVDQKYNSVKKVIECLESQQSRNTNVSRLVSKDKLVFDKFHGEFKKIITTYEQYAESQNVSQIYSLNGLIGHFNKTIDCKFNYLQKISNPDFLYLNYKHCIETCPVPTNSEDVTAREQILAMKVRLGEENILSAPKVTGVIANAQQFMDAVNYLRVSHARQEAQIKAIFSIFGSLKDAASFVNHSINSSQERVNDLHARQNSNIIGSQEQQSLEQRISRAEESIKTLHQAILPQELLREDLRNQVELSFNRLTEAYQSNIKLIEEQLSQDLTMKIKDEASQIRIQIENQFVQFNQKEEQKSRSPSADDSSLNQQVQSDDELRSMVQTQHQLSTSLQNPSDNEPQAAAAIPSANLFSQEMLDRLLSIFNLPINNYTPVLNQQGHSKITEEILNCGWKLSLDELNSKASSNRIVEWTTFEGAQRAYPWFNLEQGVYYGQMADGKRDGYGIVYTTDAVNNPWLYECQWNEGIPIQGRFIRIGQQEQCYKEEGGMDHAYRVTATNIVR